MVVVSRRIFLSSTVTPLSAMGLIVGLGIGDESGKEALGSSVEPGRADAPPIETGTVLGLTFTMGSVVGLGTIDGSLVGIVDSRIDVDVSELFSVALRDCSSLVDG